MTFALAHRYRQRAQPRRETTPLSECGLLEALDLPQGKRNYAGIVARLLRRVGGKRPPRTGLPSITRRSLSQQARLISSRGRQQRPRRGCQRAMRSSTQPGAWRCRPRRRHDWNGRISAPPSSNITWGRWISLKEILSRTRRFLPRRRCDAREPLFPVARGWENVAERMERASSRWSCDRDEHLPGRSVLHGAVCGRRVFEGEAVKR